MLQYAPVGALVGLILAAELIVVVGGNAFAPQLAVERGEAEPDIADAAQYGGARRHALHATTSTSSRSPALMLLVAMIGAIVLTLRHKEGVKRQDVPAQVARTPATAIEVKKVETGKGI